MRKEGSAISAERVLYVGHPDPFVLEILGRPLAPDMVLDPLADDPRRAREQMGRARLAVVADGPLTAEQLAHARRIERVVTLGVGLDKIDVAAVEACGADVRPTSEGTPEAVAEHAVLLLLAACRHLPAHDRGVRDGAWPKWEFRDRMRGLHGARVGIAGFGRIGQAVAVRLAAFGARLEFFDPAGVRPPAGLVVRAARSFIELAERCDVLTLHMPLTPETENLVGRRALAALGSGGILVNTARGALVDEAALAEALHAGTIAAAALDVLRHEPPEADHPLLTAPNIVLTPHVASGTVQALETKARAVADSLRAARGRRAGAAAPGSPEEPR